MTYLEKESDDRLVFLFVDGNNEAFDVLLSRYETVVHDYIYLLLGDADLTDDLFQDTFIKVLSLLKGGRYVACGKFKSWLNKIAHNVVMDYFRKQQTKSIIHTCPINDQMMSSELVDDGNSISDIMQKEQQMLSLYRQIDCLPEEQREVVRLRIENNLSFREIAERTGVSINTALGRMRYAMMSLRKTVSSF